MYSIDFLFHYTVLFNCKMTMKVLKKKTLIDMFQYLAFLILGILAISFMREVLDQFTSHDTSLKQSEVTITEYPTVTVCLKGNVTFEYGSEFSISLGDFNLTLSDDEYEEYKMEYDYVEEDITLVYTLQKIYSHIINYPCYRVIQSGYKIITGIPTFLSINFYDKNNQNKMPDIEVYFTSIKNSDGIIFSEWMDGDELKFTFPKVRTNLPINSKIDSNLSFPIFSING